MPSMQYPPPQPANIHPSRQPPPRFRPGSYSAAPGTINITRKRRADHTNGDWWIKVGVINIERRDTTINVNGYPICKVCGHPYDHNGDPHTVYEIKRHRQGKGPIQIGETITGPDGNIYRWDGKIWYRL